MKPRPRIPDQLTIARLRARQTMPYFTGMVMSLHPVERPGIGTMAVDKHGRLYWDPKYLEQTSDEELPTTVLHEVLHLYLRHHSRLLEALEDPLRARCAELAKELAVNTSLAESGLEIPEGWVMPQRFQTKAGTPFPRGASTEQYYDLLLDALQPDPTENPGEDEQESGAAGADDHQQQGDTGEDTSGGAGQGADDPSAEDANGEASQDGEDAGSAAQDDPKCQQTGQEAGQPPDPGGDQSTESESQGGGDQAGEDRPGGSEGAGDDAGQEDHGDEAPKPIDRSQGQGGSSHDGHQRSWELPPPDPSDQDSPPGYDPGELEILVERTAHEIEEAEKSRGNVPAGLAREAKRILHPTVDPVRQLESKARFAVSATFGYGDFSYRKPSRRQPPGGALLPRHQRPLPRVLVIADTSGSMGQRDLGLALGVIARVLRKLPDPRGVEVWTGDTQVGSAQRVFRPEQIQLVGGGGTDMAAMIQEAVELPRPPDVILVATDGYTPWPEHPVKARVVACFTTQRAAHRAPHWIEKVVLQPEG